MIVDLESRNIYTDGDFKVGVPSAQLDVLAARFKSKDVDLSRALADFRSHGTGTRYYDRLNPEPNPPVEVYITKRDERTADIIVVPIGHQGKAIIPELEKLVGVNGLTPPKRVLLLNE